MKFVQHQWKFGGALLYSEWFNDWFRWHRPKLIIIPFKITFLFFLAIKQHTRKGVGWKYIS